VTPLNIIAEVSRVVTMAADRILGDRTDFPLYVAMAASEALKNYEIQSQVMYGKAGWVEIMENQAPVWAGCWGQNSHFWLATVYGEVVDLNTHASGRKFKSLYSPPLLWSAEVPRFFRYLPEGVAELDGENDSHHQKLELLLNEVRVKCRREMGEPDFPNEPIICPLRKILDDSRKTFQYYDRALSVAGIPELPHELTIHHTH
jgi:hypothetical protein